jgi:hypothetical protein
MGVEREFDGLVFFLKVLLKIEHGVNVMPLRFSAKQKPGTWYLFDGCRAQG